ncbi:MAG: hypothetical protein NTW28_18840 [Candidatus Solibacter sp.]|nr:hypothetical protein [Candidatus Solibacter sp.]
MSKSSLRVLAVLLTAGIIAVLFAGLDGLPGAIKAQIAAERKSFTVAQSQIQSAQAEVSRNLATESALFRALPSAREYPDRLGRAANSLAAAGQSLAELEQLEKQDRRSDRTRAESLLGRQKQVRAAAVADAESVRKDAAHWVDLKQHLPQEVQDMERDHKAIHAVDLAAAAAAVQKAQADWPEKQNDLESRLATARGVLTRSDELWQSTTEARRAAAANDYTKLDFGALFAAADTLKTGAADLPKQAEQLKTLSAQLYESWDKILVDMEVRGSGNARAYNQKIKTVRTKIADATGKASTAASDEKWVDVSKAQYQAMEKNLGMAIEHKPAGKYDTESERVAQPAGFAYMAPQGQSNQYGHWEQRNGTSFWVFYGQYALMRDLLFNRDYRPMDYREYQDYRTYRERNQTYYGRDTASQAPKYGTSGTATQEKYSGSTFSKSGGFKDSKYASKAGGYRDSQYSSPAAKDPNVDRSPRRFGSGSSRPAEQPRAAPPPSRSYRPAPTPYRPSAPRSPGRSFGGSRRR